MTDKADNREKVYSQAYKKMVLDIFDRAIREPGEDVKFSENVWIKVSNKIVYLCD